VVFDLGKVLVDFDYGIAVRKIAARSRKFPAEVGALLLESSLLLRYETGQIDRSRFYAELCQGTGFEGTLEEFGLFFADIFTPIEPMIAVHGALRGQRTPTFILSNTNDLAIEHIRRSFPFFGNFEGYVFSYEHGAMKPDAKLYQRIEEMAGASREKILFLDDRLENVAAAQARGWHGIHHRDPQQTSVLLREFGLLR
jgi:FMN phosphatase YigB (HAD superfamily)